MRLRKLSFFNSNDSNTFTINVWRFDPNTDPQVPANRTLIWAGEFSGYSGYSPSEINVDIDKGYGLGLEIDPPNTGIKPANINVRVLIRQR